jgi:DNA-binding NarL/FixJ family response regulator
MENAIADLRPDRAAQSPASSAPASPAFMASTERASLEASLDIRVFRALGRHSAPALHFSAVDDAVAARSSLLAELVSQGRNAARDGQLDLAIVHEDDALHIRVSCRQPVASLPTKPQGLTLMLTPLTPAENRVLALLPTHLPFVSIAEACHVSRNTVKTQVSSVYRKLGVSSRHRAVLVAQELGLIPQSPDPGEVVVVVPPA